MRVLLLAGGLCSAAVAAPKPDFTCVESYREANEEYFSARAARASVRSPREREDIHRIWRIYQDIELRRFQSEDIRGLMGLLGAKPNEELKVMRDFVELLESGEACTEGRPAKSWGEVVAILKSSLRD